MTTRLIYGDRDTDGKLQFNNGGLLDGTLIEYDGSDPTELTLTLPDGSAAGGSGLSISAGAGDGANAGGSLAMTAGVGGDTGDGGDIEIIAGNGGGTSGAGGDFALAGGSAQGGDSDGGNIILSAGVASGAGVAGAVIIAGDAYFEGDGFGLPYGSIYGNEIGWTQAAAVQNTWYPIADTDMTDGHGGLNLIAHDGSGKLTVTLAGRYLVNYSVTLECSALNKHVQIGIAVDGSVINDGTQHYEVSSPNAQLTLGSTAIVSLGASGYVEIAIRTTDTGTPDLSVDHLNVSLVHVGG